MLGKLLQWRTGILNRPINVLHTISDAPVTCKVLSVTAGELQKTWKGNGRQFRRQPTLPRHVSSVL